MAVKQGQFYTVKVLQRDLSLSNCSLFTHNLPSFLWLREARGYLICKVTIRSHGYLSCRMTPSRETAVVRPQMKQDGFGHFVGISGSKVMLEEAQKKGLYKVLKQCILGEQPLPVESDAFDVVVICGAVARSCVPVSVVRELCITCKPGGYVCMTCRHSPDNLEYKASLESELKQMQGKGLWSCVAVTEVENWIRGVTPVQGASYSPAHVYLYKKL